MILPVATLVAPLLLRHLQQLSPDIAVGTALFGCALVAVEANRPGLVLPGSAGLLAFLLAAAMLAADPVRPWALTLLSLCAALLVWSTRRRVPFALLLFAVCGLSAGLYFLLPHSAPRHVSGGVAILSGVTAGVAGAALARIAFRARLAKQVN